MNRIMFVCSEPSDVLETSLLATGCEIIKVSDGESAIFQAQHAIFDMAVIVSTGKTMDVAETVFNLRDINRSMQIVVLEDEHGTAGGVPVQVITHAAPTTRAVTVDGLARYLGVSGRSAKRHIRKRQ